MNKQYVKIVILFLLMLSIVHPLWADNGKIKKGVYYAPTGHFLINSPIGRGATLTFSKSKELESIRITSNNHWGNDGLWMAGFMVAPKQNMTAEEFEIGAKRELNSIASHFFESRLDPPKLQYARSFTVNGRPALQYCYTGLHQLHIANLIATLVLGEDSSIAHFDVMYKDDPAKNSDYQKRYALFMNSFKKP